MLRRSHICARLVSTKVAGSTQVGHDALPLCVCSVARRRHSFFTPLLLYRRNEETIHRYTICVRTFISHPSALRSRNNERGAFCVTRAVHASIDFCHLSSRGVGKNVPRPTRFAASARPMRTFRPLPPIFSVRTQRLYANQRPIVHNTRQILTLVMGFFALASVVLHQLNNEASRFMRMKRQHVILCMALTPPHSLCAGPITRELIILFYLMRFKLFLI